ncbi:hypothetical protein NPIL_294581 [Nephila pilipes]|uniref:Uncharacterized protein n=1 Tax=Nephila pilipes TaxID=299642 RepID=A0A8X6QN02_NEPPI|nr:hypothetical protein NPIL_294581 [Nephila pilipes]
MRKKAFRFGKELHPYSFIAHYLKEKKAVKRVNSQLCGQYTPVQIRHLTVTYSKGQFSYSPKSNKSIILNPKSSLTNRQEVGTKWGLNSSTTPTFSGKCTPSGNGNPPKMTKAEGSAKREVQNRTIFRRVLRGWSAEALLDPSLPSPTPYCEEGLGDIHPHLARTNDLSRPAAHLKYIWKI